MDETILIAYLQNQCDEEEAERVEAWCDERPENRKTLEQLYCTLFIADRVKAMNAVDTEASLKRLKSAIHKKEKNARLGKISSGWKRYGIAVAAFITGLCFAGGVAWSTLSDKLSDYEVQTMAGQRAQATLPDGTKVWLNASSKMVYHSSLWNSTRQVDLSGEAYFEVTPNKHAPFIVNSRQIKTRVLGTKFNVRAKEEENKVVTTLFQGSVRVDSPRTKEDGYLLKPGQTLNIDVDNYQAELIEYSHPNDVLQWINGKLEFRQHSLWEITNIMEILYDIKFVYESDELKKERFTGDFSTDSKPEEILNVLVHTNHFSYKKEGHIIRLMKK